MKTGQSNHRSIGKSFEDIAASYLREQNVKILAQNYTSYAGEIDIIGIHNEILCFIEVKYRHTKRYGSPQEAVNQRKQERIIKTATVYLYQHPNENRRRCRFDVIAMDGNSVTWIQNAFERNG